MSDRIYEVLAIADPNLGEPEVDELITQIEGFIEKEGAHVQKVERWGKKRLAYLVKKHREGYYVLFVVEGHGEALKEVERRLRVIDGVIRFMSVRVDVDLRKAERRKARRVAEEEKKRSRMAARAAAATAEREGVQP